MNLGWTDSYSPVITKFPYMRHMQRGGITTNTHYIPPTASGGAPSDTWRHAGNCMQDCEWTKNEPDELKEPGAWAWEAWQLAIEKSK